MEDKGCQELEKHSRAIKNVFRIKKLIFYLIITTQFARLPSASIAEKKNTNLYFPTAVIKY